VGLGEATVKVSLNWEGVSVASTTHRLSVRNALGGPPLPVSRRLVRSLVHPDRTANVWRVAFMPRGQLFTAGYPSGVIQVWDPVSGKEVRRIESPRGLRYSAAYALTLADFSRLYVPIDARKVQRDTSDQKAPYRIEHDGRVLVWDLASGKELPPIRPRPGWGVYTAFLSPDGKQLVSVERTGHAVGSPEPENQIRLVDTATGRSRPVGEGYGMAAFSRDSRRIYLARWPFGKGKASTLVVLDTEGKELARLARLEGGAITSPVLSPDGKRLVVKAGKGGINDPDTLKVFDTALGKEIASLGNGSFMASIFSPDGTLLAASDYNGQVTVWDVGTKKVVRRQRFVVWRFGENPAFSPDGRRLAVPGRLKPEGPISRTPDPLDLPQPRVYLFDLDKEGPAEEIVCPHGWSGGAAFSADGKMLAVGGAGAVHLFDVSRAKR
jgi:WD40 repeat protein